MTLQWYALRSKPNKEDVLHDQLVMQGYEVYFPRLRVKPVNPRARTTKPYFPGYMFVHIALEQTGLSTFEWMPYALGLVGFDKVPAAIPGDVMQTLAKNIDAMNQKKANGELPYQPGSALLVNDGPFAGYEAIFDTRLPSSERIRILLMLAKGNQVCVELPASYVRLKE